MWNRIDREEWLFEIEKLNLSLFFNPDYIDIVSNTYFLNTNFYRYKNKYETLALISFLSSKNSIITPEGFSYTPYFISNNISEHIYFDICTSLIKILKKYRYINFKFEENVFDIRPFIWSGFRVELKYTHIKNNNLPSHPSVLKNLKKEIIKNYSFYVEETNDISINLNLEFLKTIGSSNNHCEKYNALLKGWSNLKFLKAFNVYKNNRLLCSNLVLVDEKSKKAYTILLNKVDSSDKYAHTYLYQSIVDWCFKNDIYYVDFCGANLQSISQFKSYYNTQLKIYFKVSYHSLLSRLFNLWNIIFMFLYKLKNKIQDIL